MNTRFNTSSNAFSATAKENTIATIDFSGKTKTKINHGKMNENIITEEELLQFLWRC